jgi:xanthine dehydrogenase YagR molybdenum-binding subunit
VTIHNTAPAMIMAADEAKAQLFAKLRDRIGDARADFSIHQGQILNHGEPVMSWGDACGAVANQTIVGRGNRNDGVAKYDQDGHSYGAQFVDLTVDTETGQIRVDRIVAIQACGKVILKKMAESQIIGGVTQGVSYALYEDRILDRNVGAMVNANLEMYKWAGAREVPLIEPVFYTNGQSSPRSLGEPPTIPTAGAIACAVYNAIGVPVRSLPLTPDRILAALDGAPKGEER